MTQYEPRDNEAADNCDDLQKKARNSINKANRSLFMFWHISSLDIAYSIADFCATLTSMKKTADDVAVSAGWEVNCLGVCYSRQLTDNRNRNNS